MGMEAADPMRTPRAQNASFNHAPTIRGYRGSIISGPVSHSATAFNFCIQGQIRLRRHLVIGSQGRWPFPGGDAAGGRSAAGISGVECVMRVGAAD
jgi:hypothetical protein